MKLTKMKLKQIIKEEMQNIIVSERDMEEPAAAATAAAGPRRRGECGHRRARRPGRGARSRAARRDACLRRRVRRGAGDRRRAPRRTRAASFRVPSRGRRRARAGAGARPGAHAGAGATGRTGRARARRRLARRWRGRRGRRRPGGARARRPVPGLGEVATRRRRSRLPGVCAAVAAAVGEAVVRAPRAGASASRAAVVESGEVILWIVLA